MLEADVESIRKTDSGLELTLQGGETLEADQVMYATGRVPNVRDLGLREIGVEFRADGRVVVDEFSRQTLRLFTRSGMSPAGST